MPDPRLVEHVRRACIELIPHMPGLRLEDKVVSFALHCREAPELAAAVETSSRRSAVPMRYSECGGRLSV